MKTKIKIAAFGAIVAAGCIAGISKSQKTESSAITMANVEALARWEISFEVDKNCVYDPNDICVPDYYTGEIKGRPVP